MKYLRIDISKSETSCLYVKVPDCFDIEEVKTNIWRGNGYQDRIDDLVSNLSICEWNSESEIEIDCVIEVEEEEANQYNVDELIEGAEDEPEKFIDPNQAKMQFEKD
jgi:hypothetical protein